MRTVRREYTSIYSPDTALALQVGKEGFNPHHIPKKQIYNALSLFFLFS